MGILCYQFVLGVKVAKGAKGSTAVRKDPVSKLFAKFALISQQTIPTK